MYSILTSLPDSSPWTLWHLRCSRFLFKIGYWSCSAREQRMHREDYSPGHEMKFTTATSVTALFCVSAKGWPLAQRGLPKANLISNLSRRRQSDFNLIRDSFIYFIADLWRTQEYLTYTTAASIMAGENQAALTTIPKQAFDRPSQLRPERNLAWAGLEAIAMLRLLGPLASLAKAPPDIQRFKNGLVQTQNSHNFAKSWRNGQKNDKVYDTAYAKNMRSFNSAHRIRER